MALDLERNAVSEFAVVARKLLAKTVELAAKVASVAREGARDK